MNLIGSIKFGTVLRTRIRIHYTWILVLVLVPWAVSTQYSTETPFTTRIYLGLGTAALFFLAVFSREILLLLVAGYKGLKVRVVTIFAFGGYIQTEPDTDSPSLTMLLAVSGMLANFLITGIFYFAFLIFGNPDNLILDVPLKWLAFFYLTLSLFHIIPAYPLEGGRMLHVLFWKLTGDQRKATRTASISGWVMGFLVMAGGIILIVLTQERFTGMFFTGLGLIIQNAATHGLRWIKKSPILPPAVSDNEGSSYPEEAPPTASDEGTSEVVTE